MDQAVRQLERQAASGNTEDLLRYIRACNKLGERVCVPRAQVADVLEACCSQQWVPRISFNVPRSVIRDLQIYISFSRDATGYDPTWRVCSLRGTDSNYICKHEHRNRSKAAECAKRHAKARILQLIKAGKIQRLKTIIELYRSPPPGRT